MRWYSVWTSKLSLIFTLMTAWLNAYGTIAMPPSLPELVAGSEHIGLAAIHKAEDYYVTDAEGVIWCGVIYEGQWVDSLTREAGVIEFVSYQVLEVRGLYLLYLADKRLSRRLLSTNSRSEAHRRHRLEREKLCERSVDLPRTVFRAAGFVDETFLANESKTGVWLEFPYFSENTLTEIVIMPTGLSIGGEEIPRDRFLSEYHDEHKHGVVRTAGEQLIIFRAVDWAEYCDELIEIMRATQRLRPSVGYSKHSFCKPKSPWLPVHR